MIDKKFKGVLITLILAPLIVSIVTFSIAELPREVSPKTDITFMTYNIHFGQGMDDLLNLERIAQNMLIDDPDIIGLQEVRVGRIETQGIDMTLWLAKRLGMDYYYFNPINNPHEMGNAILSKYPILLKNGYELPSTHMERTVVHCLVEISSNLKIDVFSTHIGIRTENKTAQINFLIEKITEISTSSNQVLMGDFNLRNDSLELGNVLTYFNDTAEEFGADPRAYVDYIFATGYLEILNSHVITDMLLNIDLPAEYGSDHLPVVSIIRYPLV